MNLLEAASLVGDAPNEDGTWKVRLISEGKGSSGVYTADLLENHHHAFDDLLSFKNHPDWDGPQARDFTMIAGQIMGETWVEKDERGLTAVYANYLPDEDYRDKLARYKDKLGLSIYIEGSGFYRDNADGTEEFVVDWFNPEDPFASVDVVHAPGARGKFMESMRKTYDSNRSVESDEKPSTTVVQEDEGDNMELEKAIEALTAQVAALVADKETAKAAEAQVTADKAEADKRVESYAATVDAVDAAELLPPQRKDILEAAKRGEIDVEAEIAKAKAVRDAAIEAAGAQLEESGHGRVNTDTTVSQFGAFK